MLVIIKTDKLAFMDHKPFIANCPGT